MAESEQAMPQHIVRLLLLIVVFGVLAYGAKKFFTADSFYEYGHYRGKSVVEIAAEKPNYKGTAYCTSCHAQQVAEWSNGVHNSIDIGKVVKCEVCHGPAGERDAERFYVPATTGREHPEDRKMVVPTDSRKLCTLCHERMTGRPLQQRQIVVADHAGTQQCTVCHNPHSPRLNLVSVTTTAQAGNAAAGKTKAGACSGCHGADGVSNNLPGPTLAGQQDAYIIDALKAYNSGARVDPMMSAAAKVSDDDAVDLAAHFTALKCESTLAADKQATLPGHTIASKCTACHGSNGVSTNRSWPNLVGQSKAYLVSALKHYSSGARKNAIMAGIVKSLSDVEIENVSTYYAAATCK